MIELERTDLETGQPLIMPFYLFQDGSMINDFVFRSPREYQHACLNPNTFEQVKEYLITPKEVGSNKFNAQISPFQNALEDHKRWVDDLWNVLEVRDIVNWYPNSSFVGHFSGDTVRTQLPKTYQRFQGTRERLAKEQRDYERRIDSLRLKFVGKAPF